MATALFTSFSGCGSDKPSEQPTDAAVVTQKQTEVSFDAQKIDIASVTNARQLGGYISADGRKVKDNMLIRTGGLDKLSDEDAEKLASQYNVKNVIDFRMDSEKSSAPDKDVPNAENTWISVLEFDMSNPEVRDTLRKIKELKGDNIQVLIEYSKIGSLDALYKSILTSESGQKGYAQFFDILIKDDGAVLWHCTHGKDRTGIAAALVLSALGVDEETIIKDFELSNEPYTQQREYIYGEALKRGCSDEDARKISLLTAGVDKNDMISALETVKAQYGSVHDYLNNQLGVSDEDIAALRDKYLEK